MPALRRDYVALLVVADGDQFCDPWSGRAGSLTELQWVQGYDGVAEYSIGRRQGAYRDWPWLNDAA